MKKFAVFSGFLGSGKTTTMMALTRYFSAHHGKAAMISNDLGGPGLADHRLAKLSGCAASELTGTCICYQTENLVARLDQLFQQEGCELVISDIPGFGIGALDHVYHKLHREYADCCQLAPFTVLCEPQVIENIQAGKDPDLCYILKNQLQEGDLILLNKCDLITEKQKAGYLAFLAEMNPSAECLPISAVTGAGLEEVCQVLMHKTASLRTPDLGYGGSDFQSAMGKISEYNLQYYAVVCCETFDGTGYLTSLAEKIQEALKLLKAEIPHMKLLAWAPEGDYGKVDLLGIQRPVEVLKPFKSPCVDLAVVINASAFCDAQRLDRLITDTVHSVSEQWNLSVTVYKKECFAVMEES